MGTTEDKMRGTANEAAGNGMGYMYPSYPYV